MLVLVRSGFGLAALTALGLMATPASARATPPSDAAVLASPPSLGTVGLLAPTPGPSTTPLFAPVLAKRGRDRKFDSSMGEVDPRKRQLPRKHRFRLAIHGQWVGLPSASAVGKEPTKFHFAPLMLDVAYQAQFLKLVMVRLALAAGTNVANSRNAMPGVIFPQAYVGVQTRIMGVAFGYGFDLTLPPNFGATDGGSNSYQQPVLQRNHVVMGELSATTRIDRVALTFSLALGGMQSTLSHYDTVIPKDWRFFMGLQAGVFFDGTIRREKKARQKAAR